MHLLRVSLRNLQPSQPYVSAEKLSRVMWQFARHELDTQEAVSLWRLGDRLVITDGHTRALAAWLMGRDRILARWEPDPLDWEAYRICVHWCEESGIHSVPNLTGRVLNTADFRRLWLDRCLQMQSQLHKERTKRRAVPSSPIIYRQPVTAATAAQSATAQSQGSPLISTAATPTQAEEEEWTMPLLEPPAALASNIPNSPQPNDSTFIHVPSEQPQMVSEAPSSPSSPTHFEITQAMLDDEMTLPLLELPPGASHSVESAPDAASAPTAETPPEAFGEAPPTSRSRQNRESFELGDMTLPLDETTTDAFNRGRSTSNSQVPRTKRQRKVGRSASASKALPTKGAQPSPAQRNSANRFGNVPGEMPRNALTGEYSRPITAISWADEDQTVIDMPQTKINPKKPGNGQDSDDPPATDAPSTSIPAQSQS